MLRDGIGFSKVIICCSRVDLRRGIDGLASFVQLNYGIDTLEKGTLFLFRGVNRDRCRGLMWEGDGYTLLTKRLAPGSRFQWPKDADEAKRLTSEQFKRLMEGFTIEGTIHEVYPNLNIENTNRKA